MWETNSRIAKIQGVCIHPEYKGDFSGEVLLETRKDCVYYNWTIHRIDGAFIGTFIASVSRPVSFKVIPDGENPFEYALNHAIVGINKYRITRKKAFQVKNWQWEN